MLIIDNLLCDNLVGVFYKDLRENKGIIYSLYSFYPTLFLTSYYLIIFVSDSSSSEFKVFYTARNILENMDKQENIDDEINTAKIRIINKIYLAFDNPYTLANSFVYSLLYKNKSISPFYLADNLYYIDNQYIKQVAKKYLNNFWVFRLEGDKN
jgi:predicted Zn-dependent peptidase